MRLKIKIFSIQDDKPNDIMEMLQKIYSTQMTIGSGLARGSKLDCYR